MTARRVRARGPWARALRWTGAVVALAAAGTALVGCAPEAAAPAMSAVTAAASPTPRASTTPWPTPSARATPSAMSRSVPVRLVVPAIGVDTDLMALGLEADGTLQVPPRGFPAGWYTGGPTPGERGPAVIAGHVSWTGPGVFHDLAAMVVGDTVTVVRADGSVAAFRVVGVREYPKDEFPTAAVYGDTAGPELRMITCGGEFNKATGHYADNIVVYAVLDPGPAQH